VYSSYSFVVDGCAVSAAILAVTFFLIVSLLLAFNSVVD